MNRMSPRFWAMPALVLAACASVPKAPPERDLAAKQFQVFPGKAQLYVFRDESLGGAVRMSVLLDGRWIGDTAAQTFLTVPVDPGPHKLLSKAENDSEIEFTAEPDQAVFVWQEVKMGLWSARSKLQLKDETTGRAAVSNCSLVQGPF